MRLHTFHIWTLSLTLVVSSAFLLLIDGSILALDPVVTKVPETLGSTGAISVGPAQAAQIFLSMREREKTADNDDQSKIFLHFKQMSDTMTMSLIKSVAE